MEAVAVKCCKITRYLSNTLCYSAIIYRPNDHVPRHSFNSLRLLFPVSATQLKNESIHNVTLFISKHHIFLVLHRSDLEW